MSIASKHSYRFHYLKSDHWKNLRLQKLVSKNARCEICAFRCLQNDVHHMIYRRPLTKTKLTDLIVLCRGCHDIIHELMAISKLSQSLTKSRVFELTRMALMQWMNGPNGKRISFLSKAALKVNPGLCSICGCHESDATAHNVIFEHGFKREWDYSKWTFCEPCFAEFKSAFVPSQKAIRWYDALEEAKAVRKQLRQSKLLTVPIVVPK